MPVVDWESKPEPWRSIGLKFLDDLRGPLLRPFVFDKLPDLSGLPHERIILLRRYRRMSIGQLSRAADLCYATVDSIESNTLRRPPFDRTRLRIAAALGVSVEEIWPDE